MHEIAAHWDKTVADYLFKKGLDIHLRDKSGRTPLHVAASTNHVEIVEWLANHGADLAAKTYVEEQTPLHYAARYDAVESLQVLVSKGGKCIVNVLVIRLPVLVFVSGLANWYGFCLCLGSVPGLKEFCPGL